MRPQSIVNFERLAVAALVVGFAITMWQWDSLAAEVARIGVDPAYLPVMEAISVAIEAILIYGAARRASGLAKWLYVILFALGAASMMRTLPYILHDPLAGLASLLHVGLQAAAVYFLFAAASKQWFAHRPDPEAID